MPIRFRKVSDNLYRGGAPEEWELSAMMNTFNITKVISLDKKLGDKIKFVCYQLGLKHQIIPIHFGSDLQKELNVLNSGVKNIIGDDICYVHCRHGKDRTGCFVARYNVENGMRCKDAIDNALSFGFGTGVDAETIKGYVDCINSAKTNKDDVSINFMYVLSKLYDTKLCEACGMAIISPDTKCTHCLVTNALIRSANILEQDYNQNDKANNNALNTQQQNTFKENNMTHSTNFRKILQSAIVNYKTVKTAEQKLSYKIPAEEKQVANECIELINKICKEQLFKVQIKNKSGIVEDKDLLDILENPFNTDEPITLGDEDIKKTEKFFKLYSNLIQKNITLVKQSCVKLLDMMEIFNTGDVVGSMVKAIFDSVDKLNQETESLFEVLESVDNKDFHKNVMAAIKILRKSSAQLEQLLNERIVRYFRKEILQEDWASEIKKDIVEDKKEIQENTIEENYSKTHSKPNEK